MDTLIGEIYLKSKAFNGKFVIKQISSFVVCRSHNLFCLKTLFYSVFMLCVILCILLHIFLGGYLFKPTINKYPNISNKRVSSQEFQISRAMIPSRSKSSDFKLFKFKSFKRFGSDFIGAGTIGSSGSRRG